MYSGLTPRQCFFHFITRCFQLAMASSFFMLTLQTILPVFKITICFVLSSSLNPLLRSPCLVPLVFPPVRYFSIRSSHCRPYLIFCAGTFVFYPSLYRFKLLGLIFSLEKRGCCGSQNFGVAPTTFCMDWLIRRRPIANI